MMDRLEKLRSKLDVQWKDLAKILNISVPMLGCLRRGERNPSAELLKRIEYVEKNGVALHDCYNKEPDVEKNQACFFAETEQSLRLRICTLERELSDAREVIRNQASALALLAAKTIVSVEPDGAAEKNNMIH